MKNKKRINKIISKKSKPFGKIQKIPELLKSYDIAVKENNEVACAWILAVLIKFLIKECKFDDARRYYEEFKKLDFEYMENGFFLAAISKKYSTILSADI